MQHSIVKTYQGKQQEATAAFQEDAQKMAAKGYVPANQTWAAGSYGCGSFIVAALLCFFLIGFVIFLYMLIVKPAGTLTVTYVLDEAVAAPEKRCPQCAERVKAAAKVCRFCGHEFPNVPEVEQIAARATSTPPPSTAHELGRKLGKFVAGK